MSEAEVIALLKSINTKVDSTNIKVEALQAQMIMFQEALQPDLEITESKEKPMLETKGGDSISPPNIEVEEHIIQDLTGITILDKLPRSYLVFKNGYTAIVAYSHLKSGDRFEKGFRGDINDDLFDNRKWILKTKKDGTPNLEWKPFGKEGK